MITKSRGAGHVPQSVFEIGCGSLDAQYVGATGEDREIAMNEVLDIIGI